MPAIQTAPGVLVREIDRSGYVAPTTTTIGAHVGTFLWGPANDPQLMTNGEPGLVEQFGTPSNDLWKSFMACSHFMDYTQSIWVNRVVGPAAKNATDDGTGVLIRNDVEYEQTSIANNIKWIGKYPGTRANKIKVQVVDKDTFANWEYANDMIYTPDETGEYTIGVIDGNSEVTQKERLVITGEAQGLQAVITVTFDAAATADGTITFEGYSFDVTNGDTVETIALALQAAVNGATTGTFLPTATVDGAKVTLTYEDFGPQTTPANINDATTSVTSTNADEVTGSLAETVTIFGVSVALTHGDDALAVATKILAALTATPPTGAENFVKLNSTITYDRTAAGYSDLMTKPADGRNLTFLVDYVQAGTDGELLERYEIVGTSPDGRNDDGTTNYFFEKINNESNWVRCGDESVALAAGKYTLTGGVDDDDNADFLGGWDDYLDSEKYDFSMAVPGDVHIDVQRKAADVCETRKDAKAYVSPMIGDVVNNHGDETEDCKTWRNLLNLNSSYAVHDCNWSQVWDKYNRKYRWLPSSVDVAGLDARTWDNQFPWFSPAGPNRGIFTNVNAIAWSPNKAQQNELYKNQINPVINKSGFGFMLFGDKTAQKKPSAFDRINVRSLFIIIEKDIANSSFFQLFEQNDDITRNSLLNMIRPYLRGVQGNRGIDEFLVICDETNNTPQIIDNNTLVVDVYVKPTKSINWIQLNFIAVGHSVSFQEIVQGS